MSKALIHAKITRHPISEEVIGFRLEAAVPNMSGRVMKVRSSGDSVSFYATQQPAPSFRGQYLIKQSSDYDQIDAATLERFMELLKWEGYSEFDLVGKYQGEPLAYLMSV